MWKCVTFNTFSTAVSGMEGQKDDDGMMTIPTRPVCSAPIRQNEPIGGDDDDCDQEESQETMMEVAEVDESIVNDIVMGEQSVKSFIVAATVDVTTQKVSL